MNPPAPATPPNLVPASPEPTPVVPPTPMPVVPTPSIPVTPVTPTPVQSDNIGLAAGPPPAPGNQLVLTGIQPSIGAYIMKRWWIVLIIAVVAIGTAFLSWFFPIVIIVLASGPFYKGFENNLFSAFSVANNFTYDKKGTPSGQTGLLFNLGHDRGYSDLVAGTYRGLPLNLFIFRYTIGYGRGSQTYNRAVMTVNFATPMPAFALRRHTGMLAPSAAGESFNAAGYSGKLNLEGDFDKHFQVHIVPGTEVDVLSVLTPDVMQLMIGLDRDELELTHDGQFYIYTPGYIGKEQDLIDIFNILETIIPKITAFADRQKLIATPLAPVSASPVVQAP